ncbi:GTP-binding protein [Rhodotorula kratochvilovae]
MAILQRPFSEEYDPTVEDAYTLQVPVDGVEYSVELVDTAGQEEYRYALDQTAQSGDGFILAYSIDSEDSFELLPDFLHVVRKAKSPHDHPSPALTPDNTPFPFLVVANKCDKAPTERVVTAQQGLTFARTGGGLFFETSAKSRVNVDSSFLALIRAVARSRTLHAEHVRRLKGHDDGFFNGNVGFLERGGAAGVRGVLSPKSSFVGVRYGQDEKAGTGLPRRPTRDPSLAMDRRRSLSIGGLGQDPSVLDDKPKGCGCVVS